MSRRLIPIRLLAILLVLVAPLAVPGPAEAATITVNSTSDTSDGHCDPTHCSLREAVEAANAIAGPDSISFNIPGAGPHVIRLNRTLTLSQPSTLIAGETQPGYAGVPVIVIDGSAVDGAGLQLNHDYLIIRSLSLIHFDGPGEAALSVGGHEARIEGCLVGIDPAGAEAGNSIGLRISAMNAVVVDSFIAGNETGILLDHAVNAIIQRNQIGLNPGGEVVPNDTGIRLEGATGNSMIGGDSDDLRNTIVGSRLYGIHDASTPLGGNVIARNRIGGFGTGMVAAPNGVGVYRFTAYGSGSGALTIRRNVISGNGTGVWLNGNSHVVEDNFIGIDYLGGRALPNTEVGVRLEGCALCSVQGNVISGNPVGILLTAGLGGEFETSISHNRIGFNPEEEFTIPNGVGIQIEGGQRTVIEGNAIGGNGYGIQLNAGEATVRDNFIGVGHSAEARPFPNDVGIRIGSGFSPSTIGGTSEADGNVIAHNNGDGLQAQAAGQVITVNRIFENGGHGVHIATSRTAVPGGGLGTIISGNSIYENEGLGIAIEHPDLVAGLEPPVISRASTTEVSGTAEPNAIIEIFLAAPDPTNAGEGMTYLGYNRSDASGAFRVRLSGAGSCPIFTATATDSSGNTSAFSVNRSTCLRMPPLVGIGILVGMAGGGSAFTLVIRRRPPSLSALPWAAFGGLLGLGLGLLFLALPSVQVNWGGDSQRAAPVPMAANPPQPATLTPIPITLTPAPAPEVMALEDASCRLGPSTQFNIATYFVQGQVVRLIGRLQEGGWWQVQPPDLQLPCWVSESVAEANGDLSAVPFVIPPAPPTLTPTVEPVSPAQGCLWWNGNVFICRAPCPPGYQGAPCTP